MNFLCFQRTLLTLDTLHCDANDGILNSSIVYTNIELIHSQTVKEKSDWRKTLPHIAILTRYTVLSDTPKNVLNETTQ